LIQKRPPRGAVSVSIMLQVNLNPLGFTKRESVLDATRRRRGRPKGQKHEARMFLINSLLGHQEPKRRRCCGLNVKPLSLGTVVLSNLHFYYPRCTPFKKVLTISLSEAASRERAWAEEKTCSEAAPVSLAACVTPSMLVETSRVPVATC